ncbi:TetR/AcrR family transcriptional regulator [Rudaeicoccus suwonensis]|uniref:TetR family transcriptional regulator n=1 Tax=Rudaeicoccus suwonensis TaxID=657409 RepID=A0A561E869_9MICO|nr:TetR/AcrR family transcriptional regulator [Rudaeicoccus suwonensis]TWE11809.1 TetR family transcriptional regulator [Rudaeicoccus suwonensis]
MAKKRARLSAADRREQLISVAREMFAEQGVQPTTVEDIASAAGVTKPLIYEHFGGKEGLYAVIVDRAMRDLLTQLTSALKTDGTSREILERTALALLTYIEASPAAFRVLMRDSPTWHASGSAASLMSAVAGQVEGILAEAFKRNGFDDRPTPIYAQMLVGMIAFTGEWWTESGSSFTRDEVAAHLVTMAWHGLDGIGSRAAAR